MADIKQAAKWMQEGKLVRRPELSKEMAIGMFGSWLKVFVHGKPRLGQDTAPLNDGDLLAEDWEIAPKQKARI